MTAPACRASGCRDDATHLVMRTDRVTGVGYVHDGHGGFVQDYYDRESRSEFTACPAHVGRFAVRRPDTRDVRVVALDALMPETVRALARGIA